MQPLAVVSYGHWYFAKCEMATARYRHWKSATGDRSPATFMWTFTCCRRPSAQPLPTAVVAFSGLRFGGRQKPPRHVNVPTTGECSQHLPCMQPSPPMGTCRQSTITVAALIVLHRQHSTLHPPSTASISSSKTTPSDLGSFLFLSKFHVF